MEKLKRTCKYSELKKWYIERMEELPMKLNGNHIKYRNVKKTAELNIFKIDFEILRLGRKIKQSSIASASKNNLFEMYETLQDKNNWEKD